MSETFSTLIDYVQSQLLGFVTDPPMFGTLSASVQPIDTQLKMALPDDSLPQGIVEIDDELIFLSSYDQDTFFGTVPPWGRGQQGTIATAHASGSRVSVNPRYPRRRVAQVINQVIAGMCPPLFGVVTGEFQAQYLTWEYALPVNARTLLKVEYRPFNSAVYDWTMLRGAFIRRDTGTPMLHLPTGLGIFNAEVRYTVATDPTPLVNDSDLFTSTGLSESCIDIVSLGAIPRLVTTNDLARNQLNSVEPSERSLIVPAGSGANAAKFYMGMYQQRLAAEANRLRQLYPLRATRIE